MTAGRPLTGTEKLEPTSVRLSKDQREKLAALPRGWLREKLDAEPWPKAAKKK